MTRESIEDFREIVLPFVKKRLLETNYEGLGEADAKEFERDFNEILNMSIKALEQEPTTKNDLGVDKLLAGCEKMSFEIEIFNKPLRVVALDAVKNIVKGLPSVTPQEPRWIPVSKLPKAGEYIGDVARYYLVQNEYGDMMVASYDGIGWQQMYQHGYVEDKVVAWMTLPQKYREVEE